MSGNVGDTSLADGKLPDLAQLVGCLLLGDGMHHKATLAVIHETEVLIGLLNLNHIHEAGGVGSIGLDLAVHLDQPLLKDLQDFLAGESIPVGIVIDLEIPYACANTTMNQRLFNSLKPALRSDSRSTYLSLFLKMRSSGRHSRVL